MTLVQSLIVILAIILFGVFCQKRKLLNQNQIEGFEVFLFKIAIPCYLFAATLHHDLTELLDVKYMLSYLLAFIGMAVCVSIFFYKKKTQAEICIHIMSSSYVNAAIYVLPVITFLLRDPTAGVLGNLLQVIIIQPIMVIILSFTQHKDKSIFKKLTTIFTTPLIILPMIGLACNYLQFFPNIVIMNIFQSLGDGASSFALFAFGLTLGSVKLSRESIDKNVLFMVIGKNILHPLIAFCIGKYIFNLDAYWLYSLVIATSAPTAFVIYFIAKQFAVDPETVKKVIALSAITSLFSLMVIGLVLG